MKNGKQINHLQNNMISDDELDNIIGANKDLYDKLNDLPEIEALNSGIDQKESTDVIDRKKGSSLDLIVKIKSFYHKNELVRYASWALILIFLSTTALTFLEYEMFYNDQVHDREKFNYPPFVKLIKITIKLKELNKVIPISKEELELHKNFIKSKMKKNYF